MNSEIAQITSAVSAPVNAPAPQSAPLSAHDTARGIVKNLAEVSREKLPAEVANTLREFAKLAPVKVEFSKDKDVRKKQMTDYKKAESVYRSAIGIIVRFAEDNGAETRQRYGFSVSASGISTLSDSRKAVFKPSKSARVSF
jgi:hypothetical protein